MLACMWARLPQACGKGAQFGSEHQTESKVVEAVWTDERAVWNIKVKQGDQIITDWCHVLLHGSGILNGWSWPDIPGVSRFKGHLCQFADWADGYDFTGKTVAVIGNGSSGIQIVPELRKVAANVINYTRSPTWISAPYLEDLSMGESSNPVYSEEEKKRFLEHPDELRDYRKKMTHAFNHFYEALLEGSPANIEAQKKAKTSMLQQLQGQPELVKQVLPDWSLGCRRLTPENGYLEALCQPNTHLVMTAIKEVTARGIMTVDGKHQDLDAIVCATGFDVSFKPCWRQIGRGGRDLATEWADDATSYFSLCVSGHPNYFIYNGPAAPVAHGSLPSAIDWTAEYIIKWLIKMSREDIKSFDVKPEVQLDWNVWGDELLKRTVWASSCSSWYKRNGRISALYPGSIPHFKVCLESVRGEDFDISYRSKNLWRCLGNGFTHQEIQHGDLAYYIEH